MPTMDIFNDPAFGVSELTHAVNDLPHTPTRIGEMGLFETRGISTTSMMIERKGNTLALVQSSQRGSIGTGKADDKRKLITVSTVHLQKNDSILADKVQGVRAFGTENDLQTVQGIVMEKAGDLRADLEVTKEYHMLTALKGQMLDADGSVLLDMFTTFGFTPQTFDMVLDNAATDVKMKAIAATRLMETPLGGKMHKGGRVICSQEFYDALIAHEKVKEAFDRWMDGAFKRDSQQQQFGGGGFPFAGLWWEEYKGQVGATRFIAAGKAHLFPMGVRGMFLGRYAPADYNETVNTVGVPFYSKQERMRMDKGVELEVQTNPIFLNTQPDAVIELSI